MTTLTARPDINMKDREFWRSRQHDAWRWARANEPVMLDDHTGIWAITRHADVLAVERNAKVFSSDQSFRLIEEIQGVPLDDQSMIAQDDPDHLQARRLINRGFTPRAVREQTPVFAAMVEEMVDAVTPDGKCEVIEAFGAQFPARFTCHLLGLPQSDWRMVKEWSERAMRSDSADIDMVVLQELMEAIQQIAGTVTETVAEARGCPVGDGLLSKWAHAEVDGEPLTIGQIFSQTGLFVAGGAETTRTAIAHGLRTFCDHQDQWERLYNEPELLPTAVDEVIRWVTPLNNMFRKATEDTEVGGQKIKKGEKVALVYPSANRDEAVFDNPYEFDITRDPNPHIAFGHGTHFCIGANFARHEMELLFGKLSRDWTNLRVDSEIDVELNVFAPAVRSFGVAFDRR